MKIQPLSSPSISGATPPTTDSASTVAAKARAVAMLTGQQQETPVANPSSVTPEEVSAIKRDKPTNNVDAQESVSASEETVSTETEVKPEPPQKTPQELALEKQFAQLAKQEKALRAKAQAQEQSLKAKEAALQAREAELAAKDQQYKTGYVDMNRVKSDALSVLAEAGVSYDDITQQIMNQQPRDPRTEATLSQLQETIKRLEAKLSDNEKSLVEQQKAAYDAGLRQVQMDVDSLVNNDPEFETIKATGSQKDVVDLIKQIYDTEGKILSIEEAAREVEDYLVDEALKVTRIQKIQKRLSSLSKPAEEAPKKVEQKTEQPKQTQPMKTLTNAASSTRKLSARERAILAFNGELKNN